MLSSVRESDDLPRGPYRFFFFSREESRLHVHVASSEGEAKFWLDPEIELAENAGLAEREVSRVRAIVVRHEQQIRESWNRHFAR